jgi:hypothetical protein
MKSGSSPSITRPLVQKVCFSNCAISAKECFFILSFDNRTAFEQIGIRIEEIRIILTDDPMTVVSIGMYTAFPSYQAVFATKYIAREETSRSLSKCALLAVPDHAAVYQ